MANYRRFRRRTKRSGYQSRPKPARFPKGGLADWEVAFRSLNDALQEAVTADAAIQSACMPLRRRIAEIVSRRGELNSHRGRLSSAFLGLGGLLYRESDAEISEHRRLNEEQRQLEERIFAIAGRVLLQRTIDTPLDTPRMRDIKRMQGDVRRLLSNKPTAEEDAAWRQHQAEQRRKGEQKAQRAADKAERDEARKRKAEADRAAVASARGKARGHAESVKRALRKDHECPYCGGGLGDQPHADHVYPVSKGGRSVAANMVYVCATCNVKKGDMTLAAFIATYRLDRETIETRLQRLGKEY